MSILELDHLRHVYQSLTDEWVDAIRSEQALAMPDHSISAMEQWDTAHFRERDAHLKATRARDAYKDALRAANYGI